MMAQRHHRAGRLASLIVAAALCLALASGPAGAQTGAQDSPLIQRGVPAEATAENAVQARERAHAAARRTAWQRLAAATGASQNPSDSQLESMVSALIVEEERITGTRYVGRLTVQFASGTAGLSRSGGSGGGATIPGAPQAPAPVGQVQASIQAATQFATLREWLELRRRLTAAGDVAGFEILAISPDGARLRLALRSRTEEAQGALLAAGVWMDNSQGPDWRIGLAEQR
jgi:hypothetical protein